MTTPTRKQIITEIHQAMNSHGRGKGLYVSKAVAREFAIDNGLIPADRIPGRAAAGGVKEAHHD